MLPEALCSRCHKIPLDTLLYGPYDDKRAETLLRLLSEVWTDERCHFCLFVKELLTNHYGKDYVDAKLAQGYDQELWLYRNPLDLSFDGFAARERAERDMSFCLQVGCYTVEAFRGNPHAYFRREDRKRADDRTRDWVMPSIIAIKHQTEYADDDVKTFPIEQPGRLVNFKKIDWPLVKKWDKACSHHGVGPRKDRDQRSGSVKFDYRSQLRVIDVEKACVIHCPPDATYVALSYQWGSDQNLKLKKGNTALLETPGFFNTPEGEPARTIKDAIVTTRKLGYKYAWVDALCIVVCPLLPLCRMTGY